MTPVLFGILSVATLLSGLGVIFFRNPVYSVLSLIVCFFSIAGHYLLLHASFLAAIHIIVYAGAIMVLFLFVIMLMNLRDAHEPMRPYIVRLAALSLTGVLGLVFFNIIKSGFSLPRYLTVIQGSGTALGKVLFQDYALPFELSAVLFLSAVVGVVLLGKRSS